MAKTNKYNDAENSDASLMESPLALQDKIEDSKDFLVKNKNLLIGAAVVVALVIGGAFWYINNQKEVSAEAYAKMYNAEKYMQSDSVELALNGDGVNPGFLSIIEDYGSTDAATLAHFYVGSIYMNKGEFDKAITELEQYNGKDLILQGRALSLIGDANSEKGAYAEAVSYYAKAIATATNDATPIYLKKKAIAEMKAGTIEAAIASLETIINDFPKDFTAVADAKLLKGRFQAQNGLVK